MFPNIHTQRFALYPSTMNRRVCCRLDSRAFPRARLRRSQAPFRASAASSKMKYIGCDTESNRSIRYDPKVYMERKTCREHPSLRDLRSEPKSRSGVGGAGPLASTRSFYRPFGLACFYGTVRYCSRYRVVVMAEQARSAKRQLGFYSRRTVPVPARTKDQTGSEYSSTSTVSTLQGGVNPPLNPPPPRRNGTTRRRSLMRVRRLSSVKAAPAVRNPVLRDSAWYMSSSLPAEFLED